MSSNIIYTHVAKKQIDALRKKDEKYSNTDRTPYCYLIGWSKHNIWYYGRKTAKNSDPTTFWLKYKTSSKRVKEFLKTHGEPDIIQIRKIFDTHEQCCAWENKVLKRLNAAVRSDFLNMRNGDIDCDTTNRVFVYDKHLGIKISISSDEYKRNKNRYNFHTKNKIICVDKNDVKLSVSINDPRYVSGELTSLISKVKRVKDYNGDTIPLIQLTNCDHNYISISIKPTWYFDPFSDTFVKCLKNHPLVLNGEYINVSSHKILIEISSDKYVETYANSDFAIDAIKSGKNIIASKKEIAKINNSGRNISKSKNDTDFLNQNIDADIKKPHIGYVVTKDINGNIHFVEKTDIRIKTRELIRTLDGYIAVKDKNGNRFSVKIDDPRYLAGELVGANKNTTRYVEIVTGKIINMEKDDMRILDTNSYEKYDYKAARQIKRDRPEIRELLAIAKSKNLKLVGGWEWANDITNIREFILNSSPGSNYKQYKANKQ